MHVFSSDCFAALTSLWPYILFIWIHEFFKNHLQRRVFYNVKLSNSENILQINLTTERARKQIYRESKGINFENFPTWHQTWWHLREFKVCTHLPKKSLDTLLLMQKWKLIWAPHLIHHYLGPHCKEKMPKFNNKDKCLKEVIYLYFSQPLKFKNLNSKIESCNQKPNDL